MPEADVFVIGGGPAGLAAAIAASRKGMRVVLADGSHPPIDKACGEGLMPDCREAAARLGVDIPASAGVEFRGVRFIGARHSVQADFPAGRGLAVRRTVLHEVLVKAAEDAGVEMRWGTPVSSLNTVKARWVVGADGCSSRVRRWAALDFCVRRRPRFAYRQHFARAPWSQHVSVYWGQGCQIYVTPTASDEVGLALISRDPHLRLQDALERFFPVLRAHLRGVDANSRERGAVTGAVCYRHVAAGNVALVGDASGSVDAVTGEGIGLAFRQALYLADAMAARDLARYDAIHPGLAWRPHMMARLMLLLDREPRVCNGALAALSSVPVVFRKLLAVHVGA